MSAARNAHADDRAAVSAVLARAFADDPAMTWIFPDPADRARRLPKLFALLFDGDAEGMRFVTEGGEAATLWRGPRGVRTGVWEMLREAWPLWRALGPNLGRALAVSNAIDAHLPRFETCYLHIAGCDPAAQGRGFGGAAVRAGIARLNGRWPVYLETPKEANVSFYRALGFELTGDWAVPGGGPRFWSMLRQAG